MIDVRVSNSDEVHVNENVEDHAGAYFHLNFMFEATFIQDLFSKITIKLGFKFLDAGYGTVNTNAAVAKKVRVSGLDMLCDPDK